MIRLDTWKKAHIEDDDKVWSNTYYLHADLLDGLVHGEMGGNAAANFVNNESGLHQNIVHYPLLTAYDIDGDLTNGIAMHVHNGEFIGYWDHPGGMAPWDVVNRCSIWPSVGRPRQLFLRCGLGLNDIRYGDKGHLLLKDLYAWDGILQAAFANWFVYFPQAMWYVRHNTTPGKTVTYYNPVKWHVTGASELHAIDRRAQRYMGNGRDLFERSVDVVTECAHQWQVFWPVQFYHAEPVYGHIYFLPVRDSVGAAKALVGEVKAYFQPSGGDGGGAGNVARYYPDSTTIYNTASELESTLSSRLEDLDNIEWTGDPGNLHCSDHDYHVIMQAAWDTAKQVAWIPSCDFRTPHQDH